MNLQVSHTYQNVSTLAVHRCAIGIDFAWVGSQDLSAECLILSASSGSFLLTAPFRAPGRGTSKKEALVLSANIRFRAVVTGI